MTNNNMIFIANWKMNGEKNHISGINKTIKFLKPVSYTHLTLPTNREV